MPAARLVQWCALFGVAEGTTRVALSRMVERGELRAHDGVYELAAGCSGRASAQDWSLDPKPRRWKGDWRIAFVVAPARASADRAALRDAMRQLRYAAAAGGRLDATRQPAARVGAVRVVGGCRRAVFVVDRARPTTTRQRLAVELFDAPMVVARRDARAIA